MVFISDPSCNSSCAPTVCQSMVTILSMSQHEVTSVERDNLLTYWSFLNMIHVGGIANYLWVSNISAFMTTLPKKVVFNFLLIRIPIQLARVIRRGSIYQLLTAKKKQSDFQIHSLSQICFLTICHFIMPLRKAFLTTGASSKTSSLIHGVIFAQSLLTKPGCEQCKECKEHRSADPSIHTFMWENCMEG